MKKIEKVIRGTLLSISTSPSIVSMPDPGKPYPTLLAFLARRFPKISEQTWLERITKGKVLNEEGQPVTLTTAYMPNKRLFYFREVRQEPAIPFQERVLFINDHLMVVCKPHFLPVTPGGPYVRETLLNRLQAATGNPNISPINRIDQGTAGLVLMSVNKETRGVYQQLFMDGLVRKTYEAVGLFPSDSGRSEWLVENRLEIGAAQARFQLSPLTGKKHQLRIHMSGLGFAIVNDRYYPTLQPEIPHDFNNPLQLLSRKIEFRDPISGQDMSFTSPRSLSI